MKFQGAVDKLFIEAPKILLVHERRSSVVSKHYLPIIASVILAGLGFSSLWAQSTDYTAEVLTKGAGARPLAMGGAFAAAANDATAAYWNPAGLALIDDIEITTMHAAENDLQSYDFVNIAFNTQDAGSYAISYLRLGVDGIPETTGTPDVKGYLTYADQAGFFSGGWKVADQLVVGGTIKFLKTDIGGYGASAFGFGSDVGLLFKPAKEFAVGLVGRDLVFGGSYVTWSNTNTSPTQTLQPSLTLGLSYTQELGKRLITNNAPVPVSTLQINFDADTLYAGQSLNNYHIGLEYWYKQFVAVRGGFETKGFQFDQDSFTPSVGVGLWAYLFEIDYAFVSNSIGGIHYISLITRL